MHSPLPSEPGEVVAKPRPAETTAAPDEPPPGERGEEVLALRRELAAAQAEIARQAEALERATHAAEAAAEARDRFIANVSHELRTPLSAILLWSSLIDEQTITNPELAEALEAIKRSAEEQGALIDDIVDTSRLLAGKLRLEPEEIDLAAVVHEGAQLAAAAAGQKQIELVEDLPPAGGADRADGKRLRQMVGYLVHNAVKYTPAGGRVTVRLSRGPGGCQIDVTDTGAGLSAEQTASVLQRRPVLEGTCARSELGLGIGLVLAREIARLHDGGVEVHSEGPGHGATFTIRLPFGRLGAPADASAGLAGRRVLVADPSNESRTQLASWLQEAAARVDSAGATESGWAVFTVNRPDLLLVRLGREELDGCELVRRVRGSDDPAQARVPAIALLDGPDDALLERALECGFQTTLTPPIGPAELLATIQLLLQPEPAT